MLEEEAIQLTNKRFVPDVLANGRNKETTKQFLADATCTKVGTYGDLPIYSVKHQLAGYYFVVENDEIQYLVHYKQLRFVPTSHVCQLEVWRNEEGLCVYYLRVAGDEVGTIKEIIRVRDWRSFNETIRPKTWGFDIKAQRVRLMISLAPVRFPSKVSYRELKQKTEI